MRLFILLRLGGEGVQVGIASHLVRPHFARAGGDKAARVQRIARLFFDGHRFARQKRFVDLQLAFGEDAVGGHLVAQRQDDHVVGDDVPGGDGLLLPIAHHRAGGGGEDGQAVHLPLGEHFRDDAEGEVEPEDDHEQVLRQARVRIGERQRGQNAQQVEEGADIADEDARVRF